MKIISRASVAFDAIATEQLPTKISSQKDISRAVFDDLLERDLLGFLLSSIHLRKYLANFSTYAEPEIAQAIQRNICDVDVTDNFHKETLEMFVGAYIPESKCATQKDLMAALDAKYEIYAKDLNSGDIRYEVSLKEFACVEMAWKYRSACDSGNPLVGF